ncbi:MAG: hypothetical protein QXD20_09740, partial [Ignisphaera sp.]
GDFPELEKEIKDKKEERLSWVAPARGKRLWILLRRIAQMLRLKTLEEWLKSLNTEWVIVVDGKEIARFKDRKKALEFEKKYFVRRFRHECEG